MAPLPRLITVRFSHYCEKARWALDAAGIQYREESHVPMFSWRATYGVGGGRTVPVLATGSGVYADSTDILRWVDRQPNVKPLFPTGEAGKEVEALEEEFDRRLGPAARRVAYFFFVQDPRMLNQFLVSAGSGWESSLAKVASPLLRRIIVRGLRIDATGYERSRKSLAEVFDRVETLLRDGRRYLGGDQFSAADLTFASLASPVFAPPQLDSVFGPLSQMPSAFQTEVETYRASVAGRFGLRLYEERPPLHREASRAAA